MADLQSGTKWERHGKAGANSVVLIHGLGLNRHVWQWMLPDLTDAYDVITYDLFGHGESAPPPDKPSLTMFTRQLADVLDAAGVDRAVVVGFSLGGMICRHFAQTCPDRARALVILNSPHRRTPDAQAAIVKRVEQAALDGPAATVEAALERWFTDAYRPAHPEMMETVRRWVLANDKAVYPHVYRVLADGIDEITQPGTLLEGPALVLTGEEDYGNGPEMTHAIANQIKDAQAVVLPGLRHMALAENPPAVNGPVRTFIDGLTE